ncbi:MAG: RNA polymerase sigma factor [Bacteroidota bacterium]
MNNPLSSVYSEEANRRLVQHTLQGDREALDQLIHLHQPFIYNVAWKMTHHPDDALDLTQETLLKVITKLSQFQFNSAFRTWLYRIVVNEFLQTKRRKTESQFVSLEEHGRRLDALPNPDLTMEEEIAFAEMSREMQMRCMSGMIMCLNREQRLIYILGDTFGVDHNIGAEIFRISPQNFRIKLHRARKDLANFMDNKCGLINPDNPCRCPKKTKALQSTGALEKGKMQFNVGYRAKISDFVEAEYENVMDTIFDKVTTLFRDHPARDQFDSETLIGEILNDDDLMKYFG